MLPQLLKCLAIVAILSAIFGGGMYWLSTLHFRPPPAPIYSCGENMGKLVKSLLIFAEDNDGSLGDPLESLAAMMDQQKCLHYLVCPVLKYKPGSPDKVSEWADYTIINGLTEDSPSGTVLAYCPPENHPSDRAVVLFVDGRVRILGTEDFYKLLSEQNIERVRKGL